MMYIFRYIASNNQVAQPVVYSDISSRFCKSSFSSLVIFVHAFRVFLQWFSQTRHISRTSTPEHLKIDSLKPTPFSRKGIVHALLFRCNLVVLGRLYSSLDLQCVFLQSAPEIYARNGKGLFIDCYLIWRKIHQPKFHHDARWSHPRWSWGYFKGFPFCWNMMKFDQKYSTVVFF